MLSLIDVPLRNRVGASNGMRVWHTQQQASHVNILYFVNVNVRCDKECDVVKIKKDFE